MKIVKFFISSETLAETKLISPQVIWLKNDKILL